MSLVCAMGYGCSATPARPVSGGCMYDKAVRLFAPRNHARNTELTGFRVPSTHHAYRQPRAVIILHTPQSPYPREAGTSARPGACGHERFSRQSRPRTAEGGGASLRGRWRNATVAPSDAASPATPGWPMRAPGGEVAATSASAFHRARRRANMATRQAGSAGATAGETGTHAEPA